jgi:anti-sigma factor RsiW
MRSPSFHDIENLSAFIDGQLSLSGRRRIEKRVQSDSALAAELHTLIATRDLLRQTPQRHAPRNFTLSVRMAGVRPPVPRVVPVLSWSSAVVMLLFVFTLGTSLLRTLSFGPTSLQPLGAGEPSIAQVAATEAPVAAVPSMKTSETQTVPARPPAVQVMLATPEASLDVIETPVTAAPLTVIQPPETTHDQARMHIPWLWIWPGLGLVLGIGALIIFWINLRAFRRKNPEK